MLTPNWVGALRHAMQQPRKLQPQLICDIYNDSIPNSVNSEDWNTLFDSSSLYDAVSKGSAFSPIYEHNSNEIVSLLESNIGKNWRILEIGGGNGKLWEIVFSRAKSIQGSFTLIDPVQQSHEIVSSKLPPSISFHSVVDRLEHVQSLPTSDIIVCSLVLHHIPFSYPNQSQTISSKHACLSRLTYALSDVNSLMLVNEADMHCEVDLIPRSEVLLNNVVDSYVRRFGISLLDDVDRLGSEDSLLSSQWLEACRKWGMGKVFEVQYLDSILARDAFELNYTEWVELFDKCGLRVRSSKYTDDYNLFIQYVLAKMEV